MTTEKFSGRGGRAARLFQVGPATSIRKGRFGRSMSKAASGILVRADAARAAGTAGTAKASRTGRSPAVHPSLAAFGH